MKLIDLVKLIGSQHAFADAEIEHVRELAKENPAWGKPEDFRPEAVSRISLKRRGLGVSLILVLILLVAGFLTAHALNQLCPVPLLWIRIVRAASVLIIAWAVLSRIGYDTETLKRQTLLEITSQFGFKFFYGVGVYLAGVALFLEPA